VKAKANIVKVVLFAVTACIAKMHFVFAESAQSSGFHFVLEKKGKLISRPEGMPKPGPYYTTLVKMDEMDRFPYEFALYFSTDHARGQGGIWLYVCDGSPTEADNWVSYDEAAAAGKFDYLSDKPEANPIFVDTVQGRQTETPHANVIGGTVYMTYHNAGASHGQSTLLATSGDGMNFSRISSCCGKRLCTCPMGEESCLGGFGKGPIAEREFGSSGRSRPRRRVYRHSNALRHEGATKELMSQGRFLLPSDIGPHCPFPQQKRINGKKDPVILDYDPKQEVGDGHTGYFRWRANPFSGVNSKYVGYSLHGGGDDFHGAMWGSNDAIHWEKLQLFDSIEGYAVEEDRIVRRRAIDHGSIVDLGDGESVAICSMGNRSSGGRARRLELYEIYLADDGKTLTRESRKVLGNGPDEALDAEELDGVTSAVIGDTWHMIYVGTRGQAQENTIMGATGRLRERPPGAGDFPLSRWDGLCAARNSPNQGGLLP